MNEILCIRNNLECKVVLVFSLLFFEFKPLTFYRNCIKCLTSHTHTHWLQIDFIDLYTNNTMWNAIWIVKFNAQSVSWCFTSSSFSTYRCFCCWLFSICDSFSLSIHISVHFFPRSSSLDWSEYQSFSSDGHTHTHERNVKIAACTRIQSNRYLIVSFVYTDSHPPYTMTQR